MTTRAPRTAILLATLVLSGCGGQLTSTVTGPRGEPATPAARQPTSYDYRLTSTCGERGFLGTFDVVVRDGEVTRATAVRGFRGRVRLGEVPTLADLVELARTADDDAVVDVRLDRLGRPRSVRIDHDPGAIDDEECYAVDDLVVRGNDPVRHVGLEPTTR